MTALLADTNPAIVVAAFLAVLVFLGLLFGFLLSIGQLVHYLRIRTHASKLLELEAAVLTAWAKLSRIRQAGLGCDAAASSFNEANFNLKEGKAAIDNKDYEQARQRAGKGLAKMNACKTALDQY